MSANQTNLTATWTTAIKSMTQKQQHKTPCYCALECSLTLTYHSYSGISQYLLISLYVTEQREWTLFADGEETSTITHYITISIKCVWVVFLNGGFWFFKIKICQKNLFLCILSHKKQNFCSMEKFQVVFSCHKYNTGQISFKFDIPDENISWWWLRDLFCGNLQLCK